MHLIRRRYTKHYYENALAARPRRSQRDRLRLDLVREHVREGTLLEIGCGKGTFLDMAQEHFDVHGIDISDYAIRHSERIAEGTLIRGDIQEMSLPAARYDVVAAFGLLEHLERPRAVIDRIYRSLRNGGLFIGSTPNKWGPVGRIGTAVMDFFDRTHCSCHTPQEWRSMLVGAGFGQIAMFGEIAPTRGSCVVVRGRLWRYVSPNLMFTCIR